MVAGSPAMLVCSMPGLGRRERRLLTEQLNKVWTGPAQPRTRHLRPRSRVCRCRRHQQQGLRPPEPSVLRPPCLRALPEGRVTEAAMPYGLRGLVLPRESQATEAASFCTFAGAIGKEGCTVSRPRFGVTYSRG